MVSLAEEYDPQTQTVTVRIAEVSAIPVHWMLIAADSLQNYRASLNYLA